MILHCGQGLVGGLISAPCDFSWRLAQLDLGQIFWGLGSHLVLPVLLAASPGGELSILTTARWPQFTQTSYLVAGFS